MSIMDVLKPQSVEIKGARLVSKMSLKDDPEDRLIEIPEFKKVCRDEILQKKIRALKLRRLKEQVQRDKKRLARSTKALEDFLNA